MRDPNRLISFYDEMREIHMKYVPDWRFSQLIYNVFGTIDIYGYEEEDVLKAIKKYFKMGD